jgi:glutathionyl-hydroquinone reductase
LLVGKRLTEADLRLFPTLVRFDVAYYGALRCNLKRLLDYPRLHAYTRRIHGLPGVAETVRLDHVKRHYWDDHEMINRRIVPVGPRSTSTRSRWRAPPDPPALRQTFAPSNRTFTAAC